MSWNEVNVTHDPKSAEKQANDNRVKLSDLAQAYSRTFTTTDGERILADLTKRFVYENDTSFGSNNINYESAYHNGEAGVIKFIINQLKQAKFL
jgi:hypothetical protein